jgi:uncharacterized delta-60 repeat protein
MRASLIAWFAHVQLAHARRWHAFAVALLFTGSVSAQTPGSLDTTPFPAFASGNGKIANLAIGSGNDSANAVAVQPDGKIVLAGECSNGGEVDFCVARLNPDGSFDTNFDGPSGSGNGRFLLPIGPSTDQAFALTVQPDGKLVLAGACWNGSDYDFCVARLNPDGSLDASFDGPTGTGNGRFMLSIGTSDDLADALAIQPDGKLVLSGRCWNGSNTDFCVARLNTDGTFDASFDGPTGTGNGRILLQIGPSNDRAYSIAVLPDGKLVLAGTCFIGDNDFCFARLNSDGSLDASFGGPPPGTGNGRFVLPVGTNADTLKSIAIQPDGKLVAAGACYNGSANDFCIVRLNASGSLDSTFGIAGVSIAGIGTNNQDAIVALQADGNIVVAGTCVTGGESVFCVARITSYGYFDPSFDGPSGASDGRFLLPIGSNSDSVTALAIQPDSKLVVAGSCYDGVQSDFCVARLNGGPFGAQNCKPDIDGDGLMTATVDALINTRIMLGVRGAAVINGISFPANAKRNTWPAIRDYLVSQCGMSVY